MKVFAVLLGCISSLVLTGCFSDQVYTAPSTKTASHSEDIVKASDISADGKYSLIADSKGVCLWDNQTVKLVHKCLQGDEKKFIEVVKISATNQYYVTSNRVFVNFYSIASGKKVAQWSDSENIINDIAMSDNAEILLLGYRSGKAAIIKTKTNKTTSYDKHRLDINSVTLSADGAIAFSGSSDKKAMLWQTRDGKDLHVFKHKSRVNHVDMSADGSVGFSVDALNGRFFWDLSKGKEVAEMNTIKRFIEFNDSAFSADKRWFLTGSPKQKIKLWRVSDGELIGEWVAEQKRQRSAVLSVAFGKDNQFSTHTSDGLWQSWTLPPATL